MKRLLCLLCSFLFIFSLISCKKEEKKEEYFINYTTQECNFDMKTIFEKLDAGSYINVYIDDECYIKYYFIAYRCSKNTGIEFKDFQGYQAKKNQMPYLSFNHFENETHFVFDWSPTIHYAYS